MFYPCLGVYSLVALFQPDDRRDPQRFLKWTGLEVRCSASFRFRLHERRSKLTLTRILCISIGVRTAKLQDVSIAKYLRTSNLLRKQGDEPTI
jgi:hypothetical protein